jgi:copper transport protein
MLASVVAALTVMLGVLGLLSATDQVAAQSLTQNELVSSEPADGASLPVTPTELVFTFAEPLGEDDVLTAPVSCGNEPVNTGIPDEGDEPTIVTVAITEALPRGACTVSWALRDGLGESIASGLVVFSVQSSPPIDPATTETETTPPPAPAASSAAQQDEGDGSAGGALWLGRVLSTTAILVLFGAIVMIGVAWPEGPEYVITVRFLRSLWALALVGTVLFMVAFTAEVSDSAFGASLAPTNWLDLADAGWPGRAALARLVLVLALFWVVARPERIIDPTTQLAAYVLPGLAVVAVGLSRTGGNLAAAGVGLSIAHAFAAAVWVGGALLVARVVVAGPGEDDLVHAVRGFNRLSGPAILVTVGTGVLQMLRIVGGGLFTTSHGRVMLLKTVAVAAMVFVAVAARQLVAARLRRAGDLSAPNADRFRRAFTAEAGLGVVVLALSGWLLALPPAQFDDRPTYAVERVFTDPASGLDVSVFVGPSAVGLNGIRVEVRSPAEGISNLSVAFLPPPEAEARGIEQPIPLTGAGTAVLDQADGLPFDTAGQWTMQLTGVTPAGTLTGATTTFPVRDREGGEEASVGATEPSTEPSTAVAPPAMSIEIIELEPADN